MGNPLVKLRDKLSPRDRTYFKIAVWSALTVWMVFWLVFSITIAQKLRIWGSEWFSWMGSPWTGIMHWVAPVGIVFTALLTILLIARWVGRKLRNNG